MRKSIAQKLTSSLLRSKSSRATAQVSAESSASIADVSQSTHSAATSRNIRELSVRLDDYLERVDLSGDAVELDVISMSRQIEKVKKYTNGALPDAVVPYSMNEDDFGMVKVAAWSAKAVYASDTAHTEHIARPEEISDYFPTQHSEKIDASFRDGTVKATRIQMFSAQKEGLPSRLLVVAIRGSTSKRRDWTINFDDVGKGTEGEGFVDIEDRKYQVHGGFLECAKAMVEKVSDSISSILSKAGTRSTDGDFRLLFTGHSAGGAVASLLYAHMVSRNSSRLTELSSKFASVDCIVFGAPPVSNPALDPPGEGSTFLSIINEGDPVPRMDKDYIESLLMIYICPEPRAALTWELPQMLLNNGGTALFMKDGEENLCAVADDVGQKKIRRVLETTIFGNPRAHKMDMYLWKLGLVKGLF
ncbi:Alpha/Beta hydrolase protein [Aspergillus pseudoustus]|uniref:Alpha/Beta hydrolase protein n=1 Tax=Aspergillus pseudoustus TaxID=1810923 RepID=A0ABR4JKV3_9EURO